MSPKIPMLTAGLTALGLSWSGIATVCVADSAEPPAAVAPAASESTAPSPPTVLLLSNGKVLQGPILKEDAGYVIKHKFGEIRFKRREVEGCFATLQEAYQYKLKHTPERDPDERLKLARWCLDQKLYDEAREQLQVLLTLNPNDAQASAMLYNLDAMAERAATRDQQVARTAATIAAEEEPGRPHELDISRIRKPSRRAQALGLPAIFDLPPALAFRRYQEFTRDVHPMLQRRCAKCHNEQGQAGAFQLIPARGVRDYGNELLLRANLDATLRLVNPEDPAHSDLLTHTLLPHPPSRQLLFTGQNDPAYRLLSQWVNSLKAPK
ncbi:MAG: hypothetical protein IRY99_21165, partial [Isosphaeraceae bacterium]|nr:hypothetical protein [Isosphaeraceae bacterium]